MNLVGEDKVLSQTNYTVYYCRLFLIIKTITSITRLADPLEVWRKTKINYLFDLFLNRIRKIYPAQVRVTACRRQGYWCLEFIWCLLFDYWLFPYLIINPLQILLGVKFDM